MCMGSMRKVTSAMRTSKSASEQAATEPYSRVVSAVGPYRFYRWRRGGSGSRGSRGGSRGAQGSVAGKGGDSGEIIVKGEHAAAGLGPVEIFVGAVVAVVGQREAEEGDRDLPGLFHRKDGADRSAFAHE